MLLSSAENSVWTKIGEDSDIAFCPQKQGTLLLKPRKSTKVAKKAGAKSPFAKSTVLTTPSLGLIPHRERLQLRVAIGKR